MTLIKKKEKPTFQQYLQRGGWKKVGKTVRNLTGISLALGFFYFMNLATKSKRTERYFEEGAMLFESLEKSSLSGHTKFKSKENVNYGQNLSF